MKKGILGLGVIFIILAGYLYWNKNVDFLNPKGTNPSALRVSPLDKGAFIKVMGFLPTWNVGKTIEYTDEISHLIFLGIEVDANGNLIWDYQAKKMKSEIFLKQKQLIWENGGKNILGIKLFEDEKIDKLMASNEAQDNLIKQLTELFRTQKFDGVNVDFEYMGSPTAVLSEEIATFMTRLKNENFGEISLDVFVNTVIRGEKESLIKMIEAMDYLIIMAYDFHRPGVDYAGPVAPVGAPVGERSILELVENIQNLGLDKNKIVLAYPLYGYEWKTYGSEFGAAVKRGWSALASYKRMATFAKATAAKWDEESMTPWVTFKESGVIHQIYFENLESISRKIELAKNNQIGGIGFWALGYEGENSEVWDF